MRIIPESYKIVSENESRTLLLLYAGVILLAFIIVLAVTATNMIKRETVRGIEKNLLLSLDAKQSDIALWFEMRKHHTRHIAESASFRPLLQEISTLYKSKGKIVGSNSLKKLQDLMHSQLQDHGDLGFHLITPDHVSIASNLNSEIGKINIISGYGNYLEDVFAGEEKLLTPLPQKPSSSEIKKGGKYEANRIFVAVPIFTGNDKKKASFILAVEVDLSKGSTKNLDDTNVINTTDSYAFNANGRILGQSKKNQGISDILISEKDSLFEAIDHKLTVNDPGHFTHLSKESFNLKIEENIGGLDTSGYINYRGVKIVGAWLWSKELGIGLVVEQSKDEAFSSYYVIRRIVLLALGIAGTTFIFFSFFLIRGTMQLGVLNLTLRGEVQEREKAELVAGAASRAKSDFLSAMSHEMRTPLTAITGVTELMAETMLTSEQEKYLCVTESSAEMLLNVINNILDISKIESGRFELDTHPFNLRETVTQATSVVSVMAETKGLRLITEISEAVPANLIGDGARLKEVLLNLLGNAIKFTSKGEVRLEVSLSKNNIGTEKKELTFKVVDTGIGIPKDKLDEIFDRFTQADTSTKRRFGGTGLGLSISRKITELMGGELTVESEEGIGSTFSFSAFFTKDAEQPISKPYNKARKIEDSDQVFKILLAEDSEHIRFIIETFLKDTPYITTITTNGAVALAIFKASHFDLVLMDMEMPVMDGYTAVKKIREHEKEKDLTLTPVIALTAHAMTEQVERCIKAGCTDHLSKPIKKLKLLEKITEVLARRVKA